MSRYTITLKNCAFFARHGVFDEEVTLGQRFFVDAVFEVKSAFPLKDDMLDGTVDYGAAFKVIEKVVTGKRRFLIEALAEDIAEAVCSAFPQIRRASITVRKPNAPVPGVLDYVEVNLDYVPGSK